MPKIIIPLAPGFEEIEAVTLIDILRRSGMTVVTAALEGKNAIGSHGIKIETEVNIQEVRADHFDAIVLPGGMPGSENLKNHPVILSLLKEFHQKGKETAAVCAAPIALAQAGILNGKNATSYPGFEKQLGKVRYSEAPVVEDGSVITGRGPGTAAYLAFTLIKRFYGQEKADQLRQAMLYPVI